MEGAVAAVSKRQVVFQLSRNSEQENHPTIANHISQKAFSSWHDVEETGAGDGLPTECERCGKPGTPRRQ